MKFINLLLALFIIANGYTQESEPWKLQTKSGYIYYQSDVVYDNIKENDKMCVILKPELPKFSSDYPMFVGRSVNMVYSNTSNLWLKLLKGSKAKIKVAILAFSGVAAIDLCDTKYNTFSGAILLTLDKALNLGKGKEFSPMVEANFKMEITEKGYNIKINNFKYKYSKASMGVTSTTVGNEEVDLEEVYNNFLKDGGTDKSMQGFFAAINLIIIDILNYPEGYLKKIVDLYYL